MNATAVRIGIAGAGAMARQRAHSFHSTSQARVVGIYSRSPESREAFSQEIGVSAFADWEHFLSKVDAIVICLPNHLHARLACSALAAGKHVLVEYPLALTSSEALEVAATAKSANRVLLTGNTILHESLFGYLASFCETWGGFTSGASRVALYDTRLADSWYLEPSRSGSCFTAFHYHHIEYFRRLLGKVRKVRAIAEDFPDTDNPRLLRMAGGTLLLEHDAGQASVIQWYLSAISNEGLIRDAALNGPTASLTVSSESGDISCARWRAGGQRGATYFQNDWGVAGSNRTFLDAIAGRLDSQSLLQSDLETLCVAFAAEQSARTGEIVRIGDGAA